jgi:hypothetical protein
MAIRKLPLPLFAAKTRVSRAGDSPQYLHFVLAIRLDRNQCTFVCECQPLTTFRSHGRPDRCPACGVPNPLQGECEC